MKTRENISEFENLIFEGRNKEYGAYVLRKLYDKYVSISTTGAIILFSLMVSYPLITASFFQEEETVKTTPGGRPIDLKDFNTPPIQKPDIDITVSVPKTPTIKYIAPVVKPDEQVNDNLIPTVEELLIHVTQFIKLNKNNLKRLY